MSDYTSSLLYLKIKELVPISGASIEKLFASASIRNLSKGENLLNQGEICNRVYFIEHGYLRAFHTKDGLEINTNFVFENSFTTSLKSLKLAVPSDISIQAGSIATIYEFEKNKLLELYNESPEIESFGRNLLEQLLLEQEEHSNIFKIHSPAERYQYLLQHKPEIIQRISLTQIASYLGIARETLSRIRKLK